MLFCGHGFKFKILNSKTKHYFLSYFFGSIPEKGIARAPA